MHFGTIGPLQTVIRVTGPTHHFLGLELSCGGPETPPVLESVSCSDAGVHEEPFDPSLRVCREALEALDEVNRRRAVPFRLIRLRYCPDDGPVDGVYRLMTEALLAHLMGQGEASTDRHFAERT
jgi:hypothetical protein